ncbi:Gfo/Idh/MocA family oxidoreductase [Actinoplanes utahensis]|uniref:Inositol 2-dehydrogenase n=1 Tax=Actinoplanes utahensis TaxID=1869 RepID=A0A0A6UIK3_ACTUT|nr:Gfo/Idh/MocA family oxidoreductase [Actinoplanes utahensis]KHD75261.1 inositol 2-dehydrogenase [Actinoplanes utahensis]GIF30497.1 inositol 2-dehydrogenase [Actinoplanes utahensis]
MSLSIGVIGTGMIGREHIRRLTTVLSGARVTAVSDVDDELAGRVAAAIGARVLPGTKLITDPSVDAVLICSWGGTHAEYVLAAIAAGKPVFCEKPLATTSAAGLRILEAESAYGRRLVQVGYMRRYDVAYRALKRELDRGTIGAPLMMHCAHRNAHVPSFYTPDDMIADTAVHEIDMVRWMFGTEIEAVRVLRPRPSSHAGELPDPLLLILELANGVLADVEISVNAQYGYDIRGEILGESGTAALGELSPVAVRRTGRLTTPIPADWRERFLAAYDVELREWVDTVRAGGVVTGPDAWDGYAATTVSAAAVLALRTGKRVEVAMADRPRLYR